MKCGLDNSASRAVKTKGSYSRRSRGILWQRFPTEFGLLLPGQFCTRVAILDNILQFPVYALSLSVSLSGLLNVPISSESLQDAQGILRDSKTLGNRVKSSE